MAAVPSRISSKGCNAALVVAVVASVVLHSLMINYHHAMRHASLVRELQVAGAEGQAFPRAAQRAACQAGSPAPTAASLADKHPDEATILVSVIAFRDPECSRTIKAAFSAAKNPQRVFVSLVDQLDPRFPEEKCTIESDWPWEGHVRVMRMSSDLSRGSVVARYFASKQYRQEDFLLQLDAHSMFDPHWDSKAVRMWQERVRLLSATGIGDKVILSHFPLAYNGSSLQISEEAATHTAGHCSAFFGNDNIFQPRDSIITKEQAERVKLNVLPMIAGCMVFAAGRIVGDVPLDPWLLHIYHGDELDFSMRAFSRGYRIFNPTDNIIYHHYDRPHRPRTWTTHADQGYAEISHRSVNRVKAALRMDPITDDSEPILKMELDVYGISLESRRAWEREFGVNLTKGTKQRDFC